MTRAAKIADTEKRIVALSVEFWGAPPLSDEEHDIFQSWQLAVHYLGELMAEELEDQKSCAA